MLLPFNSNNVADLFENGLNNMGGTLNEAFLTKVSEFLEGSEPVF